MVIPRYFLPSVIPLTGSRNSHIFSKRFRKRLYQTYKKLIEVLILEIIYVEVVKSPEIIFVKVP